MKRLLTQVALVMFAVLPSAALYAQSQDVAYGRLTVTFNSSFLNYAAEAGVTITDLNGNALQNGSTTFRGVGGALDVATARGELVHSGGYLLNVAGHRVEFASPVIDSTNASAPIITVLVVVDGGVLGRMPLFTLQTPPGLTLPLQGAAGTVQMSNVALFLAPAIAGELNALFGANLVAPGFPAGTETQYTVFSSNSGS